MSWLRKTIVSKEDPTRRYLDVTFVECADLISVDKNGKNEPVINASLLSTDGKALKGEIFTSDAAKNDKWAGAHYSFGGGFNLMSPLQPVLLIQLQNKRNKMDLGKVEIPLDLIDKTSLTDEWYSLTKVRKMDSVSGSIRLQMKFRGPEEGTAKNEAADAANIDLEAGPMEDDEYANEDPNELVINVISGKDLAIGDRHFISGGGTSDPLVRVRLKSHPKDQSTRHIPKTLNPHWNDKLRFDEVTNASLSVEFLVEDYNRIGGNTFLGKCFVQLRSLADKKLHDLHLPLKNKLGQTDGTQRGEIHIKIQWRFNIDTNRKLAKKLDDASRKKSSKAGRMKGMLGNLGKNVGAAVFGGDGAESDESEDGLEAEDEPEQEDEAAAAAAKEERDKIEAELKETIGDMELKDGDYQLHVHIIEARDLKAENLDGTSDPVTYVEAFGQKFNTATCWGQTSCVFDDVIIFHMKNMSKEEFENGVIMISVRDANVVPGTKQKMIGAYAFDATSVYFQKDHEMYRKWVPLMDDEDADDVGVQGYLKISVQIVGPGEKLKIHDEAAELAKERIAEMQAGGDIGSLVMVPPGIRKTWNYIVVAVYRAEALPVMDGTISTLIADTGTDAFFQLEMGKSVPVRTRIKTCKGTRADMNPEFNYELWVPVSIPTMTQMIKGSVWDHDKTGSELIAFCLERFNIIDRLESKQTGIKWVNLYGAHEHKENASIVDNIKKGVKAIKKAGDAITSAIDWKEFYNRNPDKGVSYKGRVLVNFRVETKRPSKYDTTEIKPFRRKIAPLKLTTEPPSRGYRFRCLVALGSDLPNPALLGKLGKVNMYLMVSMGMHEKATKAVEYQDGTCQWNEVLDFPVVSYPIDEDQIPDAFLYLFKENAKLPICYARIKACDLMTNGFDTRADWVMLSEDKDNDQVSDNQFPGQVLIKMGFGPEDEWAKHEQQWQSSFDRMTMRQSCVLRVHVYHCKNLVAADSNGLCDPFLEVKFKGKTLTTQKLSKTLFPQYFETMEFKGISIPVAAEYLPMVTIKLYDQDAGGMVHEFLGMALFSLNSSSCVRTSDANAPLPDPTWHDFFIEEPGDSEGNVMLSAHLLEGDSSFAADLGPPPSIKPKLRQAYLEITALGMRDLKPYNFVPMNLPFLEIEVPAGSEGNARDTFATSPSRRPVPDNPNFQEKLVIPIMLPDDSRYAPTLQIRARDTRLGGFLKPVVGVGSIDLEDKLPWGKSYRPPQTDVFFRDNAPPEPRESMRLNEEDNKMSDVDAARILALQRIEEGLKADAADDPLLATNEGVPVGDVLPEQDDAVEDSGAGIFGAMRHIDLSKVGGASNRRKLMDDLFARDGLDLADLVDEPPKYMHMRKLLKGPLEDELETTPFENYALTRGKMGGSLSKLKVVGKFKGLVRVLEEEPDDNDFLLPKEVLEKPKPYVVRLYVLRGVGLTAMDAGIGGKQGTSDPYIKCTMGKFKFNDRKNAVDNCTDVDLYKCIEIETELPGVSQLKIDLMDKDLIGGDDLIGSTTIDVEDRWFDDRWQQTGMDLMQKPVQPNDEIRWAVKPLEERQLFIPSNNSSQGTLQCWMDILTPDEAKQFPPDDVALPPKQMFEVRVVIWKAKNVVAMDGLEQMSDLFVKCWPEGCAVQTTDTHWRAKKGKASWNYRLLFDVELGHNSRAMKFPYLHLQLWDKDILKYNDCVGETTFNLGMYFSKAYKKNVALKLFEKPKGAAASKLRRAQKKKNVKEKVEIPDDGEDIPPESDTMERDAMLKTQKAEHDRNADVLGDSDDEFDPNAVKFSVRRANDGIEMTENPMKGADSDDEEEGSDDEETLNNIDPAMNTFRSAAASRKAEREKVEEAKVKREAKAKAAESKGWFGFGGGGGNKDEDEEALLGGDSSDEEEAAKADDEEVKETANSIKNMTGLWDIDPEDSKWAQLYQHDHNTGDTQLMGEVCYSVQIWPKDKASVMRVGAARNNPNTDPHLPPPVGRMKFYLNPFLMGAELCGPTICAKVFCCLLCITFCVLMIFCQPFLTLIIQLAFTFT